VHGHLTRLNLIERFAVIKTADDVERTKPDPALFLAALDDLGVQANEAIVFEDSPNGVLAAKRAGIYVVAIPNPLTAQLNMVSADMQLKSLADLPLRELLSQVNAG
jgi:beta-phosphoglucomutase-like phosphatase (HAD superfamily)